MSAAPPMPPESMPSPQPGLSEPARIINTFVAPGKTFEDLKRKASWWVPWLLICIIGIAAHVTIDKKIGFEQIAHDILAQSPKVQEQPQEQQQRIIAITAASTKYGGYALPLFSLLGALVSAAVLMATFNFGLQAEISFGQSVAIMMYGWLPNIVLYILIIVSLLAGNPDNFHFQNPVATNPAFFLDSATTSKPLYSLLMAFDVINLWVVALLGTGFAINSKKKISIGTGIMVVGCWYFLIRLVIAGLAAIRS
jgi:hypothetical protein